MRNKTLALSLALVGGLTASLTTHAYVLQGRDLDSNLANGYEAVYDPDQNITWLANANYGAGSSYDNGVSTTDGRMTWQNAKDWAATLSYYGITGWRLPDTLQPDSSCGFQYDAGAPYGIQSYGYNCTGSEMGHLFYEALGGNAGEPVNNQTSDSAEEIANLALFGGTIQSNVYWSGLEYAPGTLYAWFFDASNGSQYAPSKSDAYYAWAVRPGDVAGAPEPATLGLLGLGLAGLGWARGRRRG